MKFLFVFLILLFNFSFAGANECKELLKPNSSQFLEFPDGFIFEMSTPLSPELKGDIKALAIEILKLHLADYGYLYPLTPERALEVISTSLFSTTLLNLKVKYASIQGVNLNLVIEGLENRLRGVEVNFKSSYDEVIFLLSDRQNTAISFIRGDIMDIISKAENNIDTGLYTESDGRL